MENKNRDKNVSPDLKNSWQALFSSSLITKGKLPQLPTVKEIEDAIAMMGFDDENSCRKSSTDGNSCSDEWQGMV